MTQTTARIKKSGLNFEIIVDMESALKYKKGITNVVDFLEIDRIFSDSKKGSVASHDDVELAFGTLDVYEVAGKIVKEGEVLVTQDYRDEEREKKVKQVVDFLAKNAIDPQSKKPISAERIKNALEHGHIHIKNVPLENQIKEIIDSLSKILPIRIETKKIMITVPAIHTGKAYGVLNQYKESEEWLSDGSLKMLVSVPAGGVIDFYERLNSFTHGAALTEEVKE